MQPNERPEALAELGSLNTPEERTALVEATAHLLVMMRQAELAIAAPTTPAERIAAWWRDHPEDVAKLAPNVSAAKYSYVATPGIDKTGLNLLLANDQLLGYFEIPDDPVADASGATYVTRKLTNQDVRNWYSALVTDVVRDRRIREENIAASVADWIQTPVQFASVRLDNSGVESKAQTSRYARSMGAGRVRLSAVDIDLFDRADAADQHGGGEVQQTGRGAAVVDRARRTDGREDHRHRRHRAHDRRIVADASARGGAVAPEPARRQRQRRLVRPDQRSDLSRVVHRVLRPRLPVLRGAAVRNRLGGEQSEGGANVDDADSDAADRAAAW